MNDIVSKWDRYKNLASSYVHMNHVSYLILYVTSRCDLKCNMCFYADSLNAPTGDGMTFDEIRKVSESLPYLMQLTLTGGEPFLRKELGEIMELFYTHSGTRSFTIPSNGTYTRKMKIVLTQVLQNCPSATVKVGLSLDGTKEVHNRIRGSEKSYDSVQESHAMLKELQQTYSNLIVTMSGVVSSFNVDTATLLVDEFIDKFPSDDYTLQMTRGIPKQLEAKEVEDKKFQHVVEYLGKRKKEAHTEKAATAFMVGKLSSRTRYIVSETLKDNRFQVNCVAGKRLVVLYDTGELVPCEIIKTMDFEDDIKKAHNGFSYGNIKDFDFDVQAAVDSDLGKKISTFITDTRCRCTFECAIVASIFYPPQELAKTVLFKE